MSANSKIETTLWKTVNKLLSNIVAAEYKHVVPILIILLMAQTGQAVVGINK